MNMHKINDHLT